MERFYLEIPSIERKLEVLDYLKEFLEAKLIPYGSNGLERCARGMSYEDWLSYVNESMDEEYNNSQKRVPATTYLMVRENDNKIVGIVNIRHYLDNILKNVGGHIGGSIRPNEQGKGYSKILLYFALLECNKLGLDEIMVDCTKSNVKSEKAIKSIGGVFDREFYYQPKKKYIRNYYINVKKSIDNYNEQYREKILKKSINNNLFGFGN